MRAGLLELEQDHVEIFRPAALQANLASGRRHREGVSAGLEVVRDDGVLSASELPHAIDHEPLGADAFDLRPHLDEEPA